MTRQECDPCQVIMDISPNVQDNEGGESVVKSDIDASSQKRRRDCDRDVCETPEKRLKSRSVYKYEPSDKCRVVMKYHDCFST